MCPVCPVASCACVGRFVHTLIKIKHRGTYAVLRATLLSRDPLVEIVLQFHDTVMPAWLVVFNGPKQQHALGG